MNNILKVTLLALAINSAYSMQTDPAEQFKEDFFVIASHFEKNARPYIQLFCSKQLEPLSQNATDELKSLHNQTLRTAILTQESRLTALRDHGYRYLSKEVANVYNRKDYLQQVVAYFVTTYQMDCLYLDYKFYSETLKTLPIK